MFTSDRLQATYPVTLYEAIYPSDSDFVEYVRQRMPQAYTTDEIAAARFVVREA